MVYADHIGFQLDASPARFHELGGPAPHHPRPEARIVELLDERLDDLLPLRPEERVADGDRERQALDALRRPLRANLRARDAPHFLGVRLEENAVELLAEAVGHPLFKRVLTRIREDLRGQIAQRDVRAGEQPEVGERLKRPEGVIVKLAPVEDTRDARADEEVRAEEVAPELLDLAALGEKTMSADVEVVVFVGFRARDAAHEPGFFEDSDRRSEEHTYELQSRL